MPAGQSPEDNSALIGGIVGGIVAFLLVGALIAFCVVRNRRQPKDSTSTLPESNYGRIAVAQSNYSDAPQTGNSHYDVLSANEL
jgi:hypothetical protein